MADCVRDRRGIHNVCELCGAFDNLSLCGGCKSTWYCSKEHQKYDWKYHKKSCKKKKRLLTEAKGHGSSTDNEEVNKGLDRSAESVSQPDHNIQLRDNEGVVNMSSPRVRGHTPAVLSEKDVNTAACKFSYDSVNKLTQNLDQEPFCKSKRESDPKGLTKSDSDSSFTEGSSEYFILHSEGNVLNDFSDLVNKEIMSPQTQTGGSGGTPENGSQTESKTTDTRQAYISIIESRNNMLSEYVVNCLNTYGICVVDNFLGDSKAMEILKDVKSLHTSGTFTQGQLVDSSTKSTKLIRGDILTWVDGSEKYCNNIKFLIGAMDAVLLRCKGKLANYTIKERTKAMVACYPGSGAHYMKHVDNPNGDGRCVTCIYYLNPDWNSKIDGGILRIFPQGESKVASIEPKFDRLLFFWSDRRNPHEVLPAQKTRYAITVWYYDAEERKTAVKRFKGDLQMKNSSVPLLQ